MNTRLSVIICTYNPVERIFYKCLEAVKKANRAFPAFEIIIVDNNSNNSFVESGYVRHFITQNNCARVVIERRQGLTPARLRGIKESTGDLLVFIDDDNFITEDFFLQGVKVATANTHIGSWSGQVKLVFEVKPEEWTKRYWGMLVYREFTESRWSNFPHLPETMPCGAGLFVRRAVAEHYVRLHEDGKRNVQLDRTGRSLFSGGDNDLAACACDIGLGVGLFPELVLEHFIPKTRTTKEYLLRLTEGISSSGIVFRAFRNEYPPKRSYKRTLANFIRLALKGKYDREFYYATLRGERVGQKYISQIQKP